MLPLLVIKTSSSFRTSSILSPSSIINLRCVLCSLAEAVSPGCTLMSERTPRDGWKEGFLPHLRRDNAKPPHISTVSVSVSFSSCKPLAESQVIKKQCLEPRELFNCPLLNTKLVSAGATVRFRADELEHMHAPALLSIPPPQVSRPQPTLNPQTP